jgi:uncharacterized membrane protein YhaH (DUF805 family)
MTFGESVRICLRKYVTFSGRASRSELWWFVLFSFLAALIAGFVDGFLREILGSDRPAGLLTLANLVALALALPSLAVSVRRLHDIGWSGWWVLFPVVVGTVGGGVAGGIAGYLTEAGVIGGELQTNATLAGGAVGLLAALFMLYLYVRPSQPGPNRFGPNPNEVSP